MASRGRELFDRGIGSASLPSDEAMDRRAQWLAHAVIPHESALRHWLVGQGLSEEDADDVVQEAYAKLAGLEVVDHIRNAKTYFFTVARTVVVDRVRRARIVSIVAVEDLVGFQPPDDMPSPEAQLSDRQDLRRLAEEISSLPRRRREVFILRKVHGLSQKEVASRMGVSESAVETHLALAIEALGKRLERAGRRRAQAARGRKDLTRSGTDEARS